MAGVLAYKRGGVLRRNQSHGNFFSIRQNYLFYARCWLKYFDWWLRWSGGGRQKAGPKDLLLADFKSWRWSLIIIINFDVDDWWMMMMDLISSGERDQSSWVSKTMELWERKSWGEIFHTLKPIDSIFWNIVDHKRWGDWTNSDNYFNVLRLQKSK